MMFSLWGFGISLSQGPSLAVIMIIALLTIACAWRGRQGMRLVAAGLLILLLYDPAVLRPVAGDAPKTIVVLQDQSASADVVAQDRWLQALKTDVGQQAELRLLPLPQSDQGTLVVPALTQALRSVPSDQLSGVVIISDTKWHDPNLPMARSPVPVHVLSTLKNTPDRAVILDKTEAYQLAGKPFTFSLTVTDSTQPLGADIPVTLYQKGATQIRFVGNGEKIALPLPTDVTGRTTVVVSTPPVTGEVNLQNNAAVFTLNVFRDRLRVMMVSGSPHPQTRAFRSLFKQDPNMDLVHFSILRRMDSIDFTPPDEMALIPFPVDELFLNRINDFDLIVIDRYANLGLLQPVHIDRLRDFVTRGGALVFMVGAETENTESLLDAFADMMRLAPPSPYRPAPVTPRLTDRDHPITQPFRGVALPPLSGYLPVGLPPSARALIVSPEGAPILTVWPDTPQHGRLALITSDNLWMWRRSEDQGIAPFDSLMRRLMHWLLREPDLESPPLTCKTEKATLTCTTQEKIATIRMRRPDDTWHVWSPDADGRYRYALNQRGLWLIEADRTLIPVPFDMGPPAEWRPVASGAETLMSSLRGRVLTDSNVTPRVRFGSTLLSEISPQTLAFDRPTATVAGRSDPLPFVIPLLALLLGAALLLTWRRG